MKIERNGVYINGQSIEGKGEPYEVICPATNEVYFSATGADAAQTLEALTVAQNTFASWSKTTINERVAWMKKLCDAFNAHRADFIEAAANEMGKSYGEADRDCNTFLNSMNFFMEEGKRVYGTSVTDWDTTRGASYQIMEHRPLGVVVAHLAWNWPIQNLGLKLGPVLVSGCTCVLKPSVKSPVSALVLAEVLKEIEFPAGVVNIVTGKASVVGRVLNESKIPRMITLIGSSETGRTVMQQGATSIKRYSMELGGNAPAIVLPDADLIKAAKLIASRKMNGVGQGCSCVNRVFVHEDVHDRLIELLLQEFATYKIGWGPDDPTATGPLIDLETRDATLRLIEETKLAGAKILCGGGIPAGLPPHLANGAFLEPTLLDGVTDDMRICNVELFSPVLPVLTFSDYDDALARSNQTEYGLASYLFTYDARAIAKAIETLEFGEVYVNAITRGAWLPHVGIKESGIGCDNSKWALAEYYDLKRFTIYV